jgi:hypothetical protein
MKGSKKYGIIAIMIIASAFSVFLPIYVWPKDVSNEFDAVMFDADSSLEEIVSVNIRGHMNRRLFGGIRYTGKIKIEGSSLPDEYVSQNIQLKFGTDGIALLRYLDESGEKLKLVQKGYVHMPLDIQYIVISITDGENAKEANVNEGYFIAGPATGRQDILGMVNEKLEKILDDPIN